MTEPRSCEECNGGGGKELAPNPVRPEFFHRHDVLRRDDIVTGACAKLLD